MAKITRKAIEQAIRAATGHDVYLTKQTGYYRITGEHIAHCPHTLIECSSLQEIDLDNWVHIYRLMLLDSNTARN